MTAAVAVRREARPVRQEWRRLASPTAEPLTFDPAMIADLPGPARQWLGHAIAPETPALRNRGAGHARPDPARPVAAIHSPPVPAEAISIELRDERYSKLVIEVHHPEDHINRIREAKKWAQD
jgi:hypothetical protein